MGSRSNVQLAYIAGFLDGDGSLMLQIKKRNDSKLKGRFMCTICFYQDSRHEKPLYWIKKVLKIGYISKRNDGMTELRINGYKQVKEILRSLMPFIKFKTNQAKALLKATDILNQKTARLLSKKDLLKLVDQMLIIQQHNYVTKKKKTREDILSMLGLTP